MKILIFVALIELPNDNETETDPALVPKPTTPDDLITRLMQEAMFGRNPDIWSQHAAGPQSPSGPTDGRHDHLNDFFNKLNKYGPIFEV